MPHDVVIWETIGVLLQAPFDLELQVSSNAHTNEGTDY